MFTRQEGKSAESIELPKPNPLNLVENSRLHRAHATTFTEQRIPSSESHPTKAALPFLAVRGGRIPPIAIPTIKAISFSSSLSRTQAKST